MNAQDETQASTSPTIATITAVPGQPGERWGEFVFVGLGGAPAVTRTPSPAAPIANEELIPSAYPGTRIFGSATDVAKSSGLASNLVVEPGYVPAGYQLVGAYVVDTPEVGIVDYALAYLRSDSPRKGDQDVFAPDLWIGWTTRAPRPLAVSAVTEDLEDGRVGHPYSKTTTKGFQAVFQKWDNPASTHRSLRINSALVWFDSDGRQWWVHAPEDLDVLLKVAESLRPVS